MWLFDYLSNCIKTRKNITMAFTDESADYHYHDSQRRANDIVRQVIVTIETHTYVQVEPFVYVTNKITQVCCAGEVEHEVISYFLHTTSAIKQLLLNTVVACRANPWHSDRSVKQHFVSLHPSACVLRLPHSSPQCLLHRYTINTCRFECPLWIKQQNPLHIFELQVRSIWLYIYIYIYTYTYIVCSPKSDP